MARQLDVQYVRYYTDGSAACKVSVAEPIQTMKLPKVKKQKRILVYVDPVAIAGIIVSVLMLVLMCVGVSQLKQARSHTAAMAAYVETLHAENTALQATYENSYDLEQVEKTALALGMVPMEQVKRITISAPPAEAVEEPGTWERFYTFLTGLFA